MGNIIYTKPAFKKYGWIREHPSDKSRKRWNS